MICPLIVKAEDISVMSAMALCVQLTGGAIWIGLAQSIFLNELVQRLRARLGVDPVTIIAGATTGTIQNLTGPIRAIVIQAFTAALQDAYILAIALGGCSFFLMFISMLIERRRIPRLGLSLIESLFK